MAYNLCGNRVQFFIHSRICVFLICTLYREERSSAARSGLKDSRLSLSFVLQFDLVT